MNSLALLKPEFVKLDIALIRRIRFDHSSERLIKHLLEFALGEGMQVIAEGVENEKEYWAIKELHCPLAQGYFFGRPGPPFPNLCAIPEKELQKKGAPIKKASYLP